VEQLGVVREARDPESLDAARELIRDAERVDGRPPVSDQAMVAVVQGQREMRLYRVDARTVAVGILGEGEVDLVVAPDARRRGTGSAVLADLIDGVPGELRAWSHGENPAADALLQAAGFTPVRSLFRMALDPSLLPVDGREPAAVPLPAGYNLRTFDAARESDSADWVRVNAAAFATHPEQGRITEADFALMREEPWFDAADLFMLTGPSGLAGYTWVKTVRGEGSAPAVELYAIGVDPSHAGRGLGRALLDVTLARMAKHGPTRVDLYVDGENERAVDLYLRAGFTIDSRSRQWLRIAEGRASARMDA